MPVGVVGESARAGNQPTGVVEREKHAVKTGVRDSQASHRLLVGRQGTYRAQLSRLAFFFDSPLVTLAGWLAN